MMEVLPLSNRVSKSFLRKILSAKKDLVSLSNNIAVTNTSTSQTYTAASSLDSANPLPVTRMVVLFDRVNVSPFTRERDQP